MRVQTVPQKNPVVIRVIALQMKASCLNLVTNVFDKVIEDSNRCTLTPNDPDPSSWELDTPSYIGWKSVIAGLNG